MDGGRPRKAHARPTQAHGNKSTTCILPTTRHFLNYCFPPDFSHERRTRQRSPTSSPSSAPTRSDTPASQDLLLQDDDRLTNQEESQPSHPFRHAPASLSRTKSSTTLGHLRATPLFLPHLQQRSDFEEIQSTICNDYCTSKHNSILIAVTNHQ